MKKVRKNIIKQLKKYVDIAVIGLSGGADSLLCTLLCADALGKENIYCLSMPYGIVDEQHFNSLSTSYVNHLNIDNHIYLPIKKAVDSFRGLFFDYVSYFSSLNSGNSKSRIRMMFLYSTCCHLNEKFNKKVRVIGTGNMSEDYIGYDTKGGDSLADIFPIGNLYKSEVYKMLELYRDEGIITENMINRKPSAGLWEDQTDEKELGYSYDEMEPAIKYFKSIPKETIDYHKLSEVYKFVFDRHINNKHKHEKSFNIKIRRDL